MSAGEQRLLSWISASVALVIALPTLRTLYAEWCEKQARMDGEGAEPVDQYKPSPDALRDIYDSCR